MLKSLISLERGTCRVLVVPTLNSTLFACLFPGLIVCVSTCRIFVILVVINLTFVFPPRYLYVWGINTFWCLRVSILWTVICIVTLLFTFITGYAWLKPCCVIIPVGRTFCISVILKAVVWWKFTLRALSWEMTWFFAFVADYTSVIVALGSVLVFVNNREISV